MINLTGVTEKYFKLFGKSPKFEEGQLMSDEKTAECINYCVNNKITTEELSEVSKSKNHCNVWDYLMNEDLDQAGACKYGDLEKK